MIEKLKLKGHIIDSNILSQLLDVLEELDIVCYVSDIKLGRHRADESEAIFVVETDSKTKMNEAIEIAKKYGAQEL